MQTQTLLLLLGVTVTSPSSLVMDHKLTIPRDNPNITRLEVGTYFRDYHPLDVPGLTAGLARGGRFDERETAALVLVVSQT